MDVLGKSAPPEDLLHEHESNELHNHYLLDGRPFCPGCVTFHEDEGNCS